MNPRMSRQTRGSSGRLRQPFGSELGRSALLAALLLAALLGPVRRGPATAGAQEPSRVTLDFEEEAADSVTGEGAEARRREGDYRVRSNDIVRFGENVIIEADERVRGDVVAIGGSIRVRGYVEGDVVSVGGSVIIESTGEVRGEAISVGGRVEELGQGRLRGSSVTLPGKRHFDDWSGSSRAWRETGGIVGALVWLGFLLLFGWIATRVASARLLAVRDYLSANALSSFLWGLGALVLFVPMLLVVVFAVILLCITIVGIPLAIALLLGYVVGFALLMVAGYLCGSLALGHRIAPRLARGGQEASQGRAMLYGILGGFGLIAVGKVLHSIWLLGPLFPAIGGILSVLGWIVGWLALVMGMGALLASGGGGLTTFRWARVTGPAPTSPAASPASPSPPGPAEPGPPALPAS